MVIEAVLGGLVLFFAYGFGAEWRRTKRFPSDGVLVVAAFLVLFFVGLFAFVL